MAQAGARKGAKHQTTSRRRNYKVGTFKYRFELAARPEGPFEAIDALVDTGYVYTFVPGRILRELGLQPVERIRFTMANGEDEFRDSVEALIRLDGRVRHTVCIFGEGKDQNMLGAYALEGLGLAVDPVNKRLVPMPIMPAATNCDLEGGAP